MATDQSDNYKQLQSITGGIALVTKLVPRTVTLSYPAGQLVMGFHEAFLVVVSWYVKRHWSYSWREPC
jgi:hypothetical protein